MRGSSDPVEAHLFANLYLEPMTKVRLFKKVAHNDAARTMTAKAFEALKRRRDIVFRDGKWQINACPCCGGTGFGK